MRIRFVKNYTVKAADGPTYKEGQEIDCLDSTANHFINKGVAVEATEKPGPKKAAETKPDAK